MSCFLTGFGAALPARVVTNAEIASRLGVHPEWIERSSGIRERRWVEPGATASDLASRAVADALADAGRSGESVDYLVGTTQSPDYAIPGIAPLVQRSIPGIGPVPALDIRGGCVGAIQALDIARSLLASGGDRTAVAFGAEAQSPLLDMTAAAAEISMLFGDGAGAFVAESSPGPRGGVEVLDVLLGSDGQFAEELCLRTGRPEMNGRTVILHAVRRMTETAETICRRNAVAIDELDVVIAHQANANLLRCLGTRLGVDAARVVYNVDRLGNTGGASIFLTLNQAWREGRFVSDRFALVLGFGAGFLWGGALLRRP